MNSSDIVVEKSENIHIPKWLFIAILPSVVAMILGWSAGKVSTAKLEVKVETMQTEMDKKINKAEADIQFFYIRDDLKIIKNKLNGADEKLDRNEQTTIDTKRK